jgi:hypothetical protein
VRDVFINYKLTQHCRHETIYKLSRHIVESEREYLFNAIKITNQVLYKIILKVLQHLIKQASKINIDIIFSSKGEVIDTATNV